MKSHFSVFSPIIACLMIALESEMIKSHGDGHDHLTHDVEHIKHDIEDIDKDSVDKMSEDELGFQYFRLHDLDDNTKLDGLEVLAAINHHAKNLSDDQNLSGFLAEQAVAAVDILFDHADYNNDGYLEYSEYKKSLQSPPANTENQAKRN